LHSILEGESPKGTEHVRKRQVRDEVYFSIGLSDRDSMVKAILLEP
jgi:hypothetical protein